MDKNHLPAYWAILPPQVRYNRKLSLLAKIIYAEITALSKADGSCDATNSYFACVFNRSITQISSAINDLEKKKFIKITINKKEGNWRIIQLVPLSEKSLPYLKKLKEGALYNINNKLLNINNNININNTTDSGNTTDSNNLLFLSKDKNNKLTKSPFLSNKDVVSYLKNSKQRELRILGWYAKEKNIDFVGVAGKTQDEKQKQIRQNINNFIKRHIKVAKELAPYSNEVILRASVLAKHAGERGGFNWTLSTILKKIDHINEYFT